MATEKSIPKIKTKSRRARDEMQRVIKLRIEELRKQDKTDKEIAKMCEVDSSDISRLMNDPDRGPKMTMEMALRFYYGLNIQVGSVLMALGDRQEFEALQYLTNFYADEISAIAGLSEEAKLTFHNVVRAHLGLPPAQSVAPPPRKQKNQALTARNH